MVRTVAWHGKAVAVEGGEVDKGHVHAGVGQRRGRGGGCHVWADT